MLITRRQSAESLCTHFEGNEMFRYLVVVAIACSALLHSTAAGADEIEPYTAYIATRLADIHSGPQRQFREM